MPDEAGSAVWPGITWLDVAACGWATVAVGSHLGSQLGYLPAEDGLAAGALSVIERRTCPCGRGERPYPGGDIDPARLLAEAQPTWLPSLAGIAHHEDLPHLCRDELIGIDVRIDGWDIRGRRFAVVVGATPRGSGRCDAVRRSCGA